MEKRLSLNITTNYFCNQKCFFCVDDTKKHLTFLKKNIDKQIFKMIDSGKEIHDNIVFTSGEPTLNPNFGEYIKYSKKLGYKNITLISNGSTLNNSIIRKKLIKSGLDEIVISIHGLGRLHDISVGVKGVFDETLKGLYSLLKEKDSKLKISLSFVLNKLNYEVFYKYIYFFFDLGVDKIIVNSLRAEGFSAGSNYGIFYFSYDKFINKCLSFKEEERSFINKLLEEKKLVLIDMLPCIIIQAGLSVEGIGTVEIRETFSSENGDDSNELYGKNEYRTYEKDNGRIIDNNNNNKIYIDKCVGCKFKNKCEGIYRDYIDNFGDNGIMTIK